MDVAVIGAGIVAPRLGAEEGRAEIPLDAIPADKRTRIGRLDRLCRLFLSSSYLAVGDARVDLGAHDPERVGLSFGTGFGCLLTNAEFYDKVVEQGARAASPRLFAYTVSSAAAGEVSIALGIRGPNATQHAGLAGGLAALAYGFDLVATGKAEIVLAGGADACGPALVEGLRHLGLCKSASRARPFTDAVSGIVPSEGAAVFVLEARGGAAEALGSVLGYAAGFEPTLASRAPRPRGIAETMRRALAQAGVGAADVDVVVSSAHGTPCDTAELAAVREVVGQRALVLAPKALFGEAFGASALLGLAMLAGPRVDPRTRAVAGVRGQAAQGGAGRPGDEAAYAFNADGTFVHRGEADRRAASASVVVVNGLCYSGNVLSLVFRPRE